MWSTTQNKTAARDLAIQAGTIRNPQEIIILLDSARAVRWPIQPAAEVLQAELREIGLNAKITMLERGAYTDALKRGDYHLTVLPYSALGGDPDFIFSRFIHSEGSVNKDWGIGYRNAEADRLIDQARVTLDNEERRRLYARLQEMIKEDLPLTTIYYEVSPYAYSNRLHNFYIDANFKHSLDRAFFKKQ